jgi:hypothetical protein
MAYVRQMRKIVGRKELASAIYYQRQWYKDVPASPQIEASVFSNTDIDSSSVDSPQIKA